MKLKKRQGEKFVLMLGAGASMSSGVQSTSKIMELLLNEFGQDLDPNERLEDRFDKLWKRTSDRDRGILLQPYLEHSPSVGYTKLAALIDAGYFDVALTFNFDDLLEKALTDYGFHDYKRVIRGETIDEEMQTLVDAAEPRFKLLKLHGSLQSSDHFLFDINEMNEYPPAINSLVNRVTARDIVMCGYGFKDVCVIRAFAQRGGSVICVNPSGVPRELRGFLKDRRSDDLGIDTDFDTFFGELYDALLAPPTAPAAAEKAPPNPFKFLESYHIEDSPAFAGRDDEIARFKQALAKTPPPRVIIVAGPAKAGKTSRRATPASMFGASESSRKRCRTISGRTMPRPRRSGSKTLSIGWPARHRTSESSYSSTSSIARPRRMICRRSPVVCRSRDSSPAS